MYEITSFTPKNVKGVKIYNIFFIKMTKKWWAIMSDGRKCKKKIVIFFYFYLYIFFSPLSFFHDISTLKGFLRQKAILTTYMHYILSKKHDLNDFEKKSKMSSWWLFLRTRASQLLGWIQGSGMAAYTFPRIFLIFLILGKN